MINVHEQKMKVQASLTDIHVELGVLPTLTVAQDNMCEFFKLIQCDGLNMVPKCNCFFVLTKSKVMFDKNIKWLDDFSVKTELSSKTKIRLNLSTDIVDASGEKVATCVQEMCAMDATDRKLRMLNTTLLPEDIECTKIQDIQFEKLMEDFGEEDFVKEVIVDVSNLDFYKHTNNLEYVRFMLSTLPLDFLDSVDITDFEIHYISESKYGDVLKIYRKIKANSIEFQIVKNGKVITKGSAKFGSRRY